MPSSESTFIIGAIREREKTFLEEDEYTRLQQAPNAEDAIKSLVDTCYGIHLEQTGSPFTALTAHLEQEMTWLKEVVDSPSVITFITARYDALAIALAVIAKKRGAPQIPNIPSLGTLSQELLEDIVWDNEIPDTIPATWKPYIEQELHQLTQDLWSTAGVLSRMRNATLAIMRAHAITTMMQELVEHIEQHLTEDDAITTETLAQHGSAATYERMWDEKLLEIIRRHRLEPTGYDPVLAYWYAKELEVRTLRILVSAKQNELPKSFLDTIQRSRFRSMEKTTLS